MYHILVECHIILYFRRASSREPRVICVRRIWKPLIYVRRKNDRWTLIHAKRMRNAYTRSHCVSCQAMWLYLRAKEAARNLCVEIHVKSTENRIENTFSREAYVAQNVRIKVHTIRWHRNDTQFADHFELRIRFRFHAKLSQLLASLRVQCSMFMFEWQLRRYRRWTVDGICDAISQNKFNNFFHFSLPLSRSAGTWNTISPSTRYAVQRSQVRTPMHI